VEPRLGSRPLRMALVGLALFVGRESGFREAVSPSTFWSNRAVSRAGSAALNRFRARVSITSDVLTHDDVDDVSRRGAGDVRC
jgi:hypothetical protein